MIQRIMLVEFRTSEHGLIPRFAPLLNTSQIKEFQNWSSLSDLGKDNWEVISIVDIKDDKNLVYQAAILSKVS